MKNYEPIRRCHERYFTEGVVDRLIELKKKLRDEKIDLALIGSVYKLVRP